MERDYYSFQQARLGGSLSELGQAAAELQQAKALQDRQARRRAMDAAKASMRQAARKAARIEPHLAYLWYGADASDLANCIRDAWQERLAAPEIPRAFYAPPDASAVALMPAFSFLVRIPFRLAKPYLSKDDRDFYLLDNPLRKEKVFKTPMVAATGWKGALRAALWQLGYGEEHEATLRLMGCPRGSEEGQAGRLYFYPTFFNAIGLEVINPHNRATGVGDRGPILMECVPQGTTGDLVVLYVPFGTAPDHRPAEVAQDLEVLAAGIQAMLAMFGFGAKTSSGFGTVEERLAGKGILALRAELPGLAASTKAEPEPKQPVPGLPRYLESSTRLQEGFRHADGSLKPESEYKAFVTDRGREYTKKDKQLYEKAKNWWEREGRHLAETTPQEASPEPAPVQTPPVTERSFPSLSEFLELAQRVAAELRSNT